MDPNPDTTEQSIKGLELRIWELLTLSRAISAIGMRPSRNLYTGNSDEVPDKQRLERIATAAALLAANRPGWQWEAAVALELDIYKRKLVVRIAQNSPTTDSDLAALQGFVRVISDFREHLKERNGEVSANSSCRLLSD